jgi:Uncharacterized conserved protein
MIHLVKLCVGAESVEDLAYWQKRLVAERKRYGETPFPVHHTRQTPKQADELLDGGSIYWVIKGTILVRQKIRAIETLTDRGGRPCCELVFEPELILTEPQGRKAFQGWRYLKPQDAPADLKSSTVNDVPPELGLALKEAGVW